MKNLVILLLIGVIALGCTSIKATPSYYVKSNGGGCQGSDICGTQSHPFTSISDALKVIGNNSAATVYLQPGVYQGFSNKLFTIDSLSLEIISLGDHTNTVIDCQYASTFLKVVNSPSLTLSGLTIQNCIDTYGGAISLTNSITQLRDVVFFNNKAHYGGALYINGGITTLDNVRIQSNTALSSGSAIYLTEATLTMSSGSSVGCNPAPSKYLDFYLVRSTVFLENSNITNAGVTCQYSQSEMFFTSNPSVTQCSKKSLCPTIPPPIDVYPTNTSQSALYTPPCNNDGVCQPNLKEDCTTCPNDCPSCKFTGALLQIYGGSNCNPLNYSQSCLQQVQSLNDFGIKLLPTLNVLPIYGKLIGYLKVDKDDKYTFQVDGENLGLKLSLNGKELIDSYFDTATVSSSKEVFIPNGNQNLVTLEFVSYNNLLKSINVEMKSLFNPISSKLSTIFSQHVCGDGILNQFEKLNTSKYYCPFDLSTTQPDVVVCGDGICNETPSECLRDCYKELGSSCPSQVPPTRIGDKFKLNDLAAQLLNNQHMTSLPGLIHMAHGIDFLTGEEVPFYLFDFGYCNNVSYTIVQDSYRGRVYNVPDDYYAEIHPICSYDTSTSSYATASEYSSSQSEASGLSVSANANGGVGRFSGSASASYSQSKSSQQAQSLSQSREGSITSTEVKCFSSKVARKKVTFSQSFVLDISVVETVQQMMEFIKSYGSLYFKTATLGGKLQVLSVTSKSTSASMSSSELSQNQAMSFSASVTTPYVSGSASYSQSIDTDVSTSSKASYEQATSKSAVLATGGAPGSYSPDGSGPSSYGDWASTVDLLPMPIQYQVDFIGNIIPLAWKTPLGDSVRTLWFDGLNRLYKNISTANSDAYSLSLYLQDITFGNSSLLNFTVTLIDSKGEKDISYNNYVVVGNNTRDITFIFPKIYTEDVESMLIEVTTNGVVQPYSFENVDFALLTEVVYGRAYYFHRSNQFQQPYYPFNTVRTLLNIAIEQDSIADLFNHTGYTYQPPLLRIQFDAINGSFVQEYKLPTNDSSPLLTHLYQDYFVDHFFNASISLFFDLPAQVPPALYSLYNQSMAYFGRPNVIVLQTCSDPIGENTGADFYQLFCVPRAKYSYQPHGYSNNYHTIGSTAKSNNFPKLDPINFSSTITNYLSR